MPTCPNCRHTWTTTKPRKADPVGDRSLADLTTAELYAHYKATSVLEDVRFFARKAHLSDLVRAGVNALELAVQGSIPRAEALRQLVALQNTWRQENHWRRIVVPALRIERRKARARARTAERRIAA